MQQFHIILMLAVLLG
uniref:Uncharacterized protein n=1 Tax=Arundo donax TaxID=35708 RepID=A0A0A9HZV6_ARUDO